MHLRIILLAGGFLLAIGATPVEARDLVRGDTQLNVPGQPGPTYDGPGNGPPTPECTPGDVGCYCEFGADMVSNGPTDLDPLDGEVRVPVGGEWLQICTNL